MTYRNGLLLVVLIAFAAAAGGCARAARSTEGFAMVDSATLNAPFEETWQATKAVLREKDCELYTRDKRGTFVAFTQMHRYLRFLTPKRMKYTITLEEVSSDSTRISIETIQQVYGVTLLTYPDWHDRKTTDNSEALAILDAVKARVS